MHDKSMTKSGYSPRKSSSSIVRVKHGSAVVPIYQGQVHGCTRYTVVFHLNGQRMRRTFGSLQKAKAEAQLVAQRIQEGLASQERLMTTRQVEGKCLLVTHPAHPNFVLFPIQVFH